MNVLIVGGGKNKVSGVAAKLYSIFKEMEEVEQVTCINAYSGDNPADLSGQDLVLWWPDIDNAKEKAYPVKDQGAVLICSKVMREETTRVDAVTRIFNMRGNAVTAITQRDNMFEFELIDALNNTWRKTADLNKFAQMVMELYKWTKESVRVSLKKNDVPEETLAKLDYSELDQFLSLNRVLANKVAEGCGNRFFGNYSTRCTKLFPSTRKGKDFFFFSPRNVDKKYVTTADLVLTDDKYYYGERKPSVDTPVQLELYKALPGVNWMIHGHAYIKGASMTDFYCPCGDLREVDEVIQVIDKTGSTRINLLNHGFIVMGHSIENMQKHLEECEFKMIGG